jgi:hypothetical protein
MPKKSFMILATGANSWLILQIEQHVLGTNAGKQLMKLSLASPYLA